MAVAELPFPGERKSFNFPRLPRGGERWGTKQNSDIGPALAVAAGAFLIFLSLGHSFRGCGAPPIAVVDIRPTQTAIAAEATRGSISSTQVAISATERSVNVTQTAIARTPTPPPQSVVLPSREAPVILVPGVDTQPRVLVLPTPADQRQQVVVSNLRGSYNGFDNIFYDLGWKATIDQAIRDGARSKGRTIDLNRPEIRRAVERGYGAFYAQVIELGENANRAGDPNRFLPDLLNPRFRDDVVKSVQFESANAIG